jgi:putative pyruvate formate lyase activating enzyme
VLPQTLRIVDRLVNRTPRPRFVYNSNGYDRHDVLRDLEGTFDVFLPDMKYMDARLGKVLSGVNDYPEVAGRAIREMYRQMGANVLLDDDDEVVRGLIIRHLVLPGYVENSKAVLRWIADELSPSVHISLMSQYYPTPTVADHPSLGRTLSAEEYGEVLEEFERLGFYRGWVQDPASHDSYRPDFRRDHPFE